MPKVFKETSALRVSFPDGINKFVGADSYHLTPLDSCNDNETDTDGDSDLVADVDPDTLICIVGCELKMVWLQLLTRSQEGNRYWFLHTFGSSLSLNNH